MKKYDYDAIVVGSGMSGGYAAKEFCEKGYKTLVLDRGKPMEHGDYKTEGIPPWEMPFRGQEDREVAAEEQDMQRHCYAFDDYSRHHFINDKENPFEQERKFTWYRSAKVGGKSTMWARQSYRWNKLDFEANATDGHGIDWPLRYEDIEPWYDYIETFVGVAGQEEGWDELPDSKFLPPVKMNVVEREMKTRIEKKVPGRRVTHARVAHLTEPTEEHLELGRGQCQSRDQCIRGCSWGGYYSSLAGALPAAERTGNLTLTANAQVQEVVYDPKTGKASGVRYVDTVTKQEVVVSARVVFMCASTLGSVQILLNSRSEQFPNGIGNSSGVLGHYVMDHNGSSGASGMMPGFLDDYYVGRSPSGFYVPRFVNLDGQDREFVRGYGMQGRAGRAGWRGAAGKKGIGKEFKDSNRDPGNWWVSVVAFGEMLPRYENRVYLHESKTDMWGMPLLVTDLARGENTRKMKEDMTKEAERMLKAAGLKNVSSRNEESIPGTAIHEMGGACMGKDPKTSYLNKWNQSHDVSNLFVTDGASFSSGSCVNPSITFMAFTARAVDYADKQMKAGKI